MFLVSMCIRGCDLFMVALYLIIPQNYDYINKRNDDYDDNRNNHNDNKINNDNAINANVSYDNTTNKE